MKASIIPEIRKNPLLILHVPRGEKKEEKRTEKVTYVRL